MTRRLACSVAAVLATAAFAPLAGTSLAAGTMSINGSMPNGGCGPVNSVTAPGPSRIVVHVSATAAENGPPQTGAVYTQILSGSGAVLATGPTEYNATTGGTYGVRVCSAANSENPSQIQYSGEISVLAPATFVSSALGKAGVRAHSTIVWLTVNAKGGHVTLRVDDARNKVHLGASTGLKATFGANGVAIAGKGMTLRVTGRGINQHIVFHSRVYNVSGVVARGEIALA
jgi:hypothetical protein